MRRQSQQSLFSGAKAGPEHLRLTLRRGLNNAAWRAGSIILSVLAAILLMSTVPNVGRAQTANSIAYDGNSTYCGDGCCQEFTITIDTSTDTVDIILGAYGINGCSLDDLCWTSQSTSGLTFEKGWSSNPGNDDFRIVDDHTGLMWNGNPGTPHFPITLTVYICGSYDCLQEYDDWRWVTQAGSARWTSGDVQPLYEESCQTIPPCSSGCSYITVEPSGIGVNEPNCGTTICVHNATSTTLGSFTLNFNPPLDPSNPCPGGVVSCSSYTNSNTYTTSPYGWSPGPVQPNGDVKFTYIFSPNFTNCTDVCVTIPRCVLGPYYEIVTLVSPTNPGTCNKRNDDTIIVDMKKSVQVTAAMPSDSGGQNYPNPVVASSGFKTTIPFTTSADGVASIRVVDATGKEVLRDNEEVTYAGTHFFYFTANKLPAGTYYYTIEFPQGVLIASKTMLVVK